MDVNAMSSSSSSSSLYISSLAIWNGSLDLTGLDSGSDMASLLSSPPPFLAGGDPS